MRNNESSGTLNRFFAGITEYVFEARLGVADPPLVDYLTDMLLRFLRTDGLNRVRNPRGAPMLEVVDMLTEAEKRVGLARREVHQHIGDITLFRIGVFPESLERLQSVERKDYFINYCSQGKRAYQIAGSIDTDRQEDAQPEVLHRLSNLFELCAYGLGEVRREWEQRDEDGPRTLLVQ